MADKRRGAIRRVSYGLPVWVDKHVAAYIGLRASGPDICRGIAVERVVANLIAHRCIGRRMTQVYDGSGIGFDAVVADQVVKELELPIFAVYEVATLS